LKTDIIVNDRITAKNVKLIVEEKMIGVLSTRDALLRARAAGLDLVVVADSDYPVCRILDADRFRYERARADREQARKQRELTILTKEIQLRPVTGAADLSMKASRARAFLETGDKVKVTVRFRGREKTHKAEGRRIISQFIAEIGEHRIERPLFEGEADLTMILGSNVTKAEKRRLKDRDPA
jgi:translation initiation factor IF-3